MVLPTLISQAAFDNFIFILRFVFVKNNLAKRWEGPLDNAHLGASKLDWVRPMRFHMETRDKSTGVKSRDFTRLRNRHIYFQITLL